MSNEYVQGECIFRRINENPKQYKYIDKDIDTEVIIVGGGVTGAILGYYFSKNNINAVVLEKNRIAHGSTSITTSLLQYELDSNGNELKQYTSIKNIIDSYKLGLKALDEIDKFIDKHGNKCCYKRSNCLLYTSKKLEIEEIKQEYELRLNAGLSVDYVDETNNKFGFDLKAGIISNLGGAQLDPYKFTHHLLEEGLKNGLQVYENSEVISINYEEDKVVAESTYGHKITGKIIIAATGYNTELFTKRNFGIKTTTFNIATKPISEIDNIFKDFVIRDNEEPYHYFRTTLDNRLIIGGEDISFIPDIYNEKLCCNQYDILEQKLKSLFPDYKIDIEYRYCGAFASTSDNLGFIGKDPEREKLWYCLGYGANGILFAILGGIMLTELYSGEINPYINLFKVDRFDK